jgi:hypothetical protein
LILIKIFDLNQDNQYRSDNALDMMAKFFKADILFFITDNSLLLSRTKISYRRSLHDQDLEVLTDGIPVDVINLFQMLLSCT